MDYAWNIRRPDWPSGTIPDRSKCRRLDDANTGDVKRSSLAVDAPPAARYLVLLDDSGASEPHQPSSQTRIFWLKQVRQPGANNRYTRTLRDDWSFTRMPNAALKDGVFRRVVPKTELPPSPGMAPGRITACQDDVTSDDFDSRDVFAAAFVL